MSFAVRQTSSNPGWDTISAPAHRHPPLCLSPRLGEAGRGHACAAPGVAPGAQLSDPGCRGPSCGEPVPTFLRTGAATPLATEGFGSGTSRRLLRPQGRALFVQILIRVSWVLACSGHGCLPRGPVLLRASAPFEKQPQTPSGFGKMLTVTRKSSRLPVSLDTSQTNKLLVKQEFLVPQISHKRSFSKTKSSGALLRGAATPRCSSPSLAAPKVPDRGDLPPRACPGHAPERPKWRWAMGGLTQGGKEGGRK